MNFDNTKRLIAIGLFLIAAALVLFFLLSGGEDTSNLPGGYSSTVESRSESTTSRVKNESTVKPESTSQSESTAQSESASQNESTTQNGSTVSNESTALNESTSSTESTVQEESTVQIESTPQIESTVRSESTSSTESTVQIESTVQPESTSESAPSVPALRFRNQKLLNQHYEKHGIEMGFSSAEEYEKAAAAVVAHPDVLHKIEAEDGDDVYYVESTNEFVIVSTDGYLRTYFNPDRGIDYFNRQ